MQPVAKKKALHLKEIWGAVKVACFEIYYMMEGKEKELIFPKNILYARPALKSLYLSPKPCEVRVIICI